MWRKEIRITPSPTLTRVIFHERSNQTSNLKVTVFKRPKPNKSRNHPTSALKTVTTPERQLCLRRGRDFSAWANWMGGLSVASCHSQQDRCPTPAVQLPSYQLPQSQLGSASPLLAASLNPSWDQPPTARSLRATSPGKQKQSHSNILSKSIHVASIMVHAFNPSTWEAQAG